MNADNFKIGKRMNAILSNLNPLNPLNPLSPVHCSLAELLKQFTDFASACE